MDPTRGDSEMKFVASDLLSMPDDHKRYEVIDGELHVHDPTHYRHQYVCGRLASALSGWSQRTGLGEANIAVGLILDDYNSVAPDVVWLSRERLLESVGEDGWLHLAPELIAEILLPGDLHAQRDYQIKRELYSRFGVQEYWVISWQQQQTDIYRQTNGELRWFRTLQSEDTIESPMLPGFSCRVKSLFLP